MAPNGETRIQCMLTGVFIVLAPLSVATNFAFAEPSKYFRLLLTILIVGIGIVSSSFSRMRIGSQGLLAFTFVFVMAGVWSSSPMWALLNKSMFGLTCFAGVAVAFSFRNDNDLQWGLRFLGIVSAAAAITVLLVFLKNPTDVASQNRMAILGINPNTIGHTVVPLSVMAVYVALHDRSRFVRILMVGASGLLALIIIATGCRGALLTMLVGIALLVVPTVRRPGVLVMLVLLVVVTYYIGFEVLKIGGSERIANELTKNTRAGVWNWAWTKFLRSPLIGAGWFNRGSHPAYCQSMYLQVLVETGVLGAFTLLVASLCMAISWLQCLTQVRRSPILRGVCYLSLALLALELLHGVFESTPVVSSSVASLALGMGMGLAENAPRIAGSSGMRPQVIPGRQFNATVRRRPTAKEVLDSLGSNRPKVSTSAASQVLGIEPSPSAADEPV